MFSPTQELAIPKAALTFYRLMAFPVLEIPLK